MKKKDPSYLGTFWVQDPDVNEAEMELSESKSKFVFGFCQRQTFEVKILLPRILSDPALDSDTDTSLCPCLPICNSNGYDEPIGYNEYDNKYHF